MAYLSAAFYAGIAVLLLNVHTQARPAPPSDPVGCNIYGDKLYLPGEVIFKKGCYEIICKEDGIQVWDGDCALFSTTQETTTTPLEFPGSY